jgi:hypothetical protein
MSQHNEDAPIEEFRDLILRHIAVSLAVPLDMLMPDPEADDLGPLVDRLAAVVELEAPKPCESYVWPRNERTYTPKHRKHNKRGKFKRSKR